MKTAEEKKLVEDMTFFLLHHMHLEPDDVMKRMLHKVIKPNIEVVAKICSCVHAVNINGELKVMIRVACDKCHGTGVVARGE